MVKINIPINERVCYNCGSTKTYVRKDNNKECWFNAGNGNALCCICYNRLKIYPKKDKKKIQEYNITKRGKILNFKGKPVMFKERVRKDFCQICGKKRGDEYINRRGEKAIIELTHLHHIEYHENDVLKDTLELCVSCHHRKNLIQNINKYYKTMDIEDLRQLLTKILAEEYCIRCNLLLYRKQRFPFKNYDGYLCFQCDKDVRHKEKEFTYDFMTIKINGIDSIHCHCGCNLMISVYDSRGTKRRYARGHNPEFTLRPKRKQTYK
jgi:hypothetical protein